MVELGFNISEITYEKSIPKEEATYAVQVVGESIEFTKNGIKTLVIEYTVVDGEYTGAKVTDKFFLWHPTPKTAGFQKQRLKRLFEACSVDNSDNSRALLGKYLKILIVPSEDGKYMNIRLYSKPEIALGSIANFYSEVEEEVNTQVDSDDIPF